MTNDGFEILPREREERFCQILAQSSRDGHQLTLQDAWRESASGYPKPAPSPSIRVAASRCMGRERVQKRLAFLKARYAGERSVDPGDETVSARSIGTLMQTVTESLVAAAEAADRHNARNVARQLRKAITVHAGRVARVSGRVEAPRSEVDANQIAEMKFRIDQLQNCNCLR